MGMVRVAFDSGAITPLLDARKDVGGARDHLDRRFLKEHGIIADPVVVDRNGPTFRPTQCSKRLLECRAARGCFDVIRGEPAD
jgi:hypothetical protein